MNFRISCASIFTILAFGCSGDPASPGENPVAADASAADAPAEDASGPSGEAMVTLFGCRACHQSPDVADGVLSGQTSPRSGTMAYGSNLTPHGRTGLGAWTEEQVVRAIREGVDEGGRSLCRTMPRYGAAPANMTVAQARAIAQYLRSLPAVDRAISASACP